MLLDLIIGESTTLAHAITRATSGEEEVGPLVELIYQWVTCILRGAPDHLMMLSRTKRELVVRIRLLRVLSHLLRLCADQCRFLWLHWMLQLNVLVLLSRRCHLNNYSNKIK